MVLSGLLFLLVFKMYLLNVKHPPGVIRMCSSRLLLHTQVNRLFCPIYSVSGYLHNSDLIQPLCLCFIVFVFWVKYVKSTWQDYCFAYCCYSSSNEGTRFNLFYYNTILPKCVAITFTATGCINTSTFTLTHLCELTKYPKLNY